MDGDKNKFLLKYIDILLHSPRSNRLRPIFLEGSHKMSREEVYIGVWIMGFLAAYPVYKCESLISN